MIEKNICKGSFGPWYWSRVQTTFVMAKNKKKHRKESMTPTAKIAPKANPFERRFGREKHRVLNRKSKFPDLSVGQPGVSRAKKLGERKATLLKEFQDARRTNAFRDRRLGEGDAAMSAEEKMAARFAAAERMRRKRSSLFLLGEDDEFGTEAEKLTHMGKALSEIERFEDPRSDDDEEDKKLDAKFVEEAHFGGFMRQSDIEFAQGKSNSRKDWIESIIAESKKRKAERQRGADEADQLTKELDERWKSMFASLKSSGAVYKPKEDSQSDRKTDTYDTLLRELKFEGGKAKAKDRLKTEEELVQEEKQRLEKLEADRLKRMRGEDEEDEKDEESGEESEDGNSGDEEAVESDEDGEQEEEVEEEEGGENTDLEDSESDGEVDEVKVKKQNKEDGSSLKKCKEEVTNEIPYTFEVPTSYEELRGHFRGRTPSEQAVIVERIIKCNHPQFGNNNREKLQSVFVYLLQHINDSVVEEDENCLEVFDQLTPLLYDLAHFSPQHAANSVLSVIKEKYDEYKKHPRTCVSYESVIFLKLACVLFPTSDYRHPVVTPALQFMSHVLSTMRINCRQSLAVGMLICVLFIEAVHLSQRYSPEVANFLSGVLFISQPHHERHWSQVPPFKVVGPESQLLCKELAKREPPSRLKWSDSNSLDELDGEFASSVLDVALDLLTLLVEDNGGLWRQLPACSDVFHPLAKLLDHLVSEQPLHSSLQAKAKSLVDKVRSVERRRMPIAKEKAKPKILKMYEPEFDSNFDPFVKKRTGSREKLEQSKLLHKLRRERKGARKDIRADNAFLAAQRAKDQRERDQERIRKTKAILSGLGNQEGDFRKILKQKKKQRK